MATRRTTLCETLAAAGFVVLTPQMSVRGLGLLSILSRGRLSTTEVSDRLAAIDISVSRAQASSALRRLADRGYVLESHGPAYSSRGQLVPQALWSITDTGRHVLLHDLASLMRVTGR